MIWLVSTFLIIYFNFYNNPTASFPTNCLLDFMLLKFGKEVIDQLNQPKAYVVYLQLFIFLWRKRFPKHAIMQARNRTDSTNHYIKLTDEYQVD